MRPFNARIVRSAMLLASLILAACGGGGTTTSTSGNTVTTTYSSMGTDFYLTLPDNLCVSSPALCNNVPVTNRLIVASPAAATGQVTFNGVTIPFTVAAGGETILTLDPAVVITSNELVEAKGIHVTATVPVSVHVVSESSTSADGYLGIPTAAMGLNYYVMAMASARYHGSEFAVVATQNATTVTITPAAAGATKVAGVPYTISLNSGDAYQLANPAGGDMTGTLVSADKPVAVFGGHRCAEVPSNIGFCDYLVEQIPDLTLWGTTYHTVPFSGRARYTVRVMASVNGTTFSSAPAGMPASLNAGQFADVVLTGPAEFVASSPVLVAQFIHSYADDTAGKGDPSMVIVTPTATAANQMGAMDSTFGVYGLAGTSGEFINVVTQTSAVANLKLDNALVQQSLFTPLSPTSIYSIATIPVAPGVHTLAGTVPYSALVYDYGVAANSVSYAYPVGGTLTIQTTVPAPAPAPTPAPATTPTTPPTTPPSAPSVCLNGSDNHTIGDSSVNDGTGDHNNDGHPDNGVVSGDQGMGDHNNDGHPDNGYGSGYQAGHGEQECDWE